MDNFRSTTRFVGVVTLLAMIMGCGLLPKEDDPIQIRLPEPPTITADTTYPVERLDLYNEIQGSATVTPVNSTFLYFTQRGRLTELNVGPQMTVSKGQLLARLDISDLEYQLAQAELDLDIADLRGQLATIQGQNSVDREIRDLETRKKELLRERLESLISGATIRAPYAGIINRVFVELGDTVPEFDSVLEISDPTVVELQVRISATDYDEILPGQRALVAVSRDDWREATVIQTVHSSPANDPTISRETYYARVELTEPAPGNLQVNSRLSARIILDERAGTLAIPRGALREFQDETYVRVLEGEIRREVYVRTGIRTDTYVEILEGLEEGMLVIGR